jgi:hypothetical protein
MTPSLSVQDWAIARQQPLASGNTNPAGSLQRGQLGNIRTAKKLRSQAGLRFSAQTDQDLKGELDGLKHPDVAPAAETAVAGGWAWILGLGVVFVPTFGPVIFAKVEPSEVLSAELNAERLDRKQTSFPQANDDELPNVRWFAAGKPTGSPNRGGGRKVRRFTKEEAVADLVTRLAFGERFASQNEPKKRYGVAKSTMSEWLSDWEANGLIPGRLRAGRSKQLEKV